MQRFLLICAGGAAGTGLRYMVSGLLMRTSGTTFPVGTLAVNLLGSFLLSTLMYVGLNSASLGPDLRLALTTGVMGGFTTYSTFTYETLEYLQSASWGLAGLNITLTVVGCLAAAVAGFAVGRMIVGH